MRVLDSDAACREIEALAQRALALATDVVVIAVANLKDGTPADTDFDRRSEFFSECELEQIVSGFRTAGFYCDAIIGESDFMKWVLSGGARKFRDRKVLIYNTAQSGVGAGRKSLIPAFCAYHGIRTLNADAYAVGLARHKFHVNTILRASGLSVPQTWWYFGRGVWLNDARPPTDLHVIAKPTYESASIGISDSSSFVVGPDLERRLDDVNHHLLQPVVVQEFIPGREVETPVVMAQVPLALAPIGISINNCRHLGTAYLSFARVYSDDYGFYVLGDADADLGASLRHAAAAAISVLDLRGFCRVDYRVNDKKQTFITDVSTTPHLVEHSSYAVAFHRIGFDRACMLAALVGASLELS